MMLMNKLNDYLYNTGQNDINHLIAEYIKKHIDVIENMTINELANACFVSKAKISNFCKALGYDNFIAFKEDCAKEMKMKMIVLENQKENLEIDFQEHLHRSMRIIENNLLKINRYQIDALIKDMYIADCVYLYGIAYSNLLCHYVQYECDFLGKEVIILDEKLKGDYVIKERSLLIVISIEGHALDNNQRILRQLLKFSVNKWIISTDMVKKKNLEYFDHALTVCCEGSDMKDRRLMIRYLIDIVIGRYQYLSM